VAGDEQAEQSFVQPDIRERFEPVHGSASLVGLPNAAALYPGAIWTFCAHKRVHRLDGGLT
jgi:hypothetical protein